MTIRAALNGTANKAAPALAPPVVEANAVAPLDVWARFLGFPTSRLKRAVRRGELLASCRGGQYLLLGEDVLAWIRSGREAAEKRRHRKRAGH